jgi:hypothetical protein
MGRCHRKNERDGAERLQNRLDDEADLFPAKALRLIQTHVFLPLPIPVPIV